MFSNWIQSVGCRIIVLGVCLLYMLSAAPAALAIANPCATGDRHSCLSSMNWTDSCQCRINLNGAPLYKAKMPSSGTTGTNLTLVNNFFHRVYEFRICQILQKVGKNNGDDVLLIMGNKLVLYSNNQREEIATPLIPELYQDMKAISHQPFALALILGSQNFKGSLQPNTIAHLNKQKKLLEDKLESTISTEIEKAGATGDRALLKESKEIAVRILVETISAIEKVLDSQTIGDSLVNFRNKIIPEVVKAADISAALQLMNINSQVKQLLNARQATNPSNELYVVIGSGSQPHFREISLQYFSQVFNEIPGYDHFLDDRIIYAEGQYKEIDLLSTLARHILDREASEALFRSPNRLQEDLLSDSATTWLWQHQTDIPRIKQ